MVTDVYVSSGGSRQWLWQTIDEDWLANTSSMSGHNDSLRKLRS